MAYYSRSDFNSPSLQAYLDALPKSNTIKKVKENSYLTNCVGHDDENPSMFISQGNTKVVFKCFAGCTQDVLLDYFRSALGGR